MKDGYIEIHEDELKELVRDAKILAALRMGGVDNWEWYGDSISDNFDEDDFEKNWKEHTS